MLKPPPLKSFFATVAVLVLSSPAAALAASASAEAELDAALLGVFNRWLVTFSVIILVWLALTFNPIGKRNNPTENDLKTIRSKYRNFLVTFDDFVFVNGKEYRKNKDGSLHNTKRWAFNENSGDFLKVHRKIDGSYITNSESYKLRFIEYYSTRQSIRKIKAIFKIFFLSLFFWAFCAVPFYGIKDGGSGSVPPSIVFFVFALVSLFFLSKISWKFIKDTKRQSVGPEPLEPITEDFGASIPETIAPPEVENALRYRPNA